MLQQIPKAARRVNRPKMRPSPPKNSAAMARNANTAGMCMAPVKKPIVPVKPYPPNHPSIFWAPWAKKITPSANRRMVVALLLSVAISLRIMKSPPSQARCPPSRGNSISDDYPYVRILLIEANVDCLIFTACRETGAFVPDEDLEKNPVRNRFSILLSRTQVSSCHLGQTALFRSPNLLEAGVQRCAYELSLFLSLGMA